MTADSSPHALRALHERDGEAAWTRDLDHIRHVAKAIHEAVAHHCANGVRDRFLLAHLNPLLPGLVTWHAHMREHLGPRDHPSPIPHIWSIALCEFPGFAHAFHLWAVENAVEGPFGPIAADAPEPIAFSATEDAALPGAVELAIAEMRRHSPDPESSLLEWEQRELDARIAAVRRLPSLTATAAAAVDRSALLDCLVCAEVEALKRAEDARNVDRRQERRFQRLCVRYRMMRYRVTGGPTALERMLDAMAGRMQHQL